MRPFDPEKAKAGDKTVTRDGREVRVLCIDAPGGQPVIVMDDTGYITRHNLDGIFPGPNLENCNDLFMAPTKKEGWVNIFGGMYVSPEIFKTEQAALDSANHSIATVRIEWEE